MNKDKRQELRATCEAATPGPWTAQCDGGGRGGGWWSIRFDPEKAVAWKVCTSQDAAFMAATDPTTILGLLDDVEGFSTALAHEIERVEIRDRNVDRLEAEVSRLKAQLDCSHSYVAKGDEMVCVDCEYSWPS